MDLLRNKVMQEALLLSAVILLWFRVFISVLFFLGGGEGKGEKVDLIAISNALGT